MRSNSRSARSSRARAYMFALLFDKETASRSRLHRGYGAQFFYRWAQRAIIRVPFSITNLVLVGKSVTGATLVAVLPTERPRRHPKAFGTPFHFIVRDPLERPASALRRMSGKKEYLQMCDYSLDLVFRPAKVGDKLVTRS